MDVFFESVWWLIFTEIKKNKLHLWIGWRFHTGKISGYETNGFLTERNSICRSVETIEKEYMSAITSTRSIVIPSQDMKSHTNFLQWPAIWDHLFVISRDNQIPSHIHLCNILWLKAKYGAKSEQTTHYF